MTVQGKLIGRQAANTDPDAVFGNGARIALLVLVGHGDRKAERRRREDEDLDAEDILTQAEEANALDPVG